MHIKRLLSGSLAAMMVATSFNVPINVKAAEVPDTEPAAGLEENQELPSSDAEIPVDDDTNVVVEEPAVEPEVVTPEAEVVTPEAEEEAPVEETTEETPAEELVVEEETAEQEVVGEGEVTLTADMITVPDNLVYTGAEITPTITVDPDGAGEGTAAIETDYTVAIALKTNSEVTTVKDAGTYVVTVTPKEGSAVLTGEAVTREFTVAPKALEAAVVTVSGTYTYTGSTLSPTVTVKETSEAESNLDGSNDYDISYTYSSTADGTFAAIEPTEDGVKKAGFYKATATFKGNYSGTATSDAFEVAPIVKDIITFDKNSTDAIGTMTSLEVLKGTPKALTTNTFTLENSEFVGWNTESDGSGSWYADGATYTVDADQTKDGSVTLYAQWEANSGVDLATATNITWTLDKESAIYTGDDLSAEVKIKSVNVGDKSVNPTRFTLKLVGEGDLLSSVSDVKNAGSYKVVLAPATGNTNYTNNTPVASAKTFTVAKRVLTADDIIIDKKLGADENTVNREKKDDSTSKIVSFNLFYNEDVIPAVEDNPETEADESSPKKEKGTAGIAVEPKVEVKFNKAATGDAVLSDDVADNFDIEYKKNDVVGTASVELKLKDSATNVTADGTLTKTFTIVDGKETADTEWSTASGDVVKAVLSDDATKNVAGTQYGYGATYGKRVERVIPAIDVSTILPKGDQTSAELEFITVDRIYDTNGDWINSSTTDNTSKYTATFDIQANSRKAIEKDDGEYGQFVVKALGDFYEGSYTVEYPFKDECEEHTWEKVVHPASFEKDGYFEYVCKECGAVAADDTDIIVDGEPVPVGDETSRIIPRLANTIASANIYNKVAEGPIDDFNFESNPKVTFYGEPITIDDIVLTGNTNNANIVENVDGKANFTPALTGNTAIGEATLTITMADDYADGYYKGAVLEKKFDIVKAEAYVESPDLLANGSSYIYSVSRGDKLELVSDTEGAQIFYQISTKTTTPGDSLAETYILEDKSNFAALISGGKVNLYTDPIEVRKGVNVYENGYSDEVVIRAFAVKNIDGKDVYSKPKNLSANYLDAWGDVDHGYYDNNSGSWIDTYNDGPTTPEEIPEGLWISAKTMGDIDDAKVGNGLTYSGFAKVIDPGYKTPYARVFFGNKLLTYGTDYTISYKNNVHAYTLESDEEGFNAAKAPTVVITGKGKYTGIKNQYFTINPFVVNNDAYIYITSSIGTQPDSTTIVVSENGKIQQPKFKISYEQLEGNKWVTKTLKAGTDYDVDYTAIKAAANDAGYPITITAKGDYTGTLNQVLKVVSVGRDISKASVAIDTNGVTFDGSLPQDDNVKYTVKLGDKLLVKDTDFTVDYYYQGVYSTIEQRSSVYSAGKYTVTITGTGDFCGKVVKTVNIKATGAKSIAAKTVSVIPSETEIQYDYYSTNKPTTIVVKDGNDTLKEDIDYVLRISNNNKVGTAKINVYGIGAYTGTKTATYKLVAKDLKKEATVTVSAAVDYTGYEQTPVITVKVPNYDNPEKEDVTLIKGNDNDYIVTYPKDMTNAGTKSIKITGVNGWKGSQTVKWTINTIDVPTTGWKPYYSDNDLKVAESDADCTVSYTNAAAVIYNRLFGLRYYSDEKIGKDNFTFKITGEKGKGFKPGSTVTVKITGKKNFNKQTVTGTYVVDNASIENSSIVITDVQYKNDKTVKRPTITVTSYITGKKLAAGEKKDYVVNYLTNDGNYTPVGAKEVLAENTEYIARITGTGNGYEGYKDVVFKVVPAAKDLSRASVTVNRKLTYDGIHAVTIDKDDLTVVLDKLVVASENFEIDSITNNKKAGTATVRIHGIGEYAGYKDVKLPIAKGNVNYSIQFKADRYGLEDGKLLTISGAQATLVNQKNSVFTLPTTSYKATVVTSKVEGKKTVYTTDTYALKYYYEAGKPDGTKYYPGNVIDIATLNYIEGTPLTLVAKFVKVEAKKSDTWTLKYDGNGQTSKNASKAVSVKVGATHKIAAQGFAKKGYTLLGFAKDKNATTPDYALGTLVSNLADPGKDTTIYAVWQEAAPKTYKITYNLDGGTLLNNDGDFAYTEKADGKLPTTAPTKVGYTFKEWQLDKAKVTKIDKALKKNVTVKAVYTPVEKTLSYAINDGSGAAPVAESTKITPSTKFEIKAAPTSTAANKDELTFLGWAKDPKSVKPDYKAGQKNVVFVTDDNITLYGVWKHTAYKITYALNAADKKAGAKFAIAGDKTYTTADAVANNVSLGTAKMPGSKFDGWLLDNETTAKSDADIITALKTAKKDVTLTPKFSENTTKVSITLDTKVTGYNVIEAVTGDNPVAANTIILKEADGSVKLPEFADDKVPANKVFIGWSGATSEGSVFINPEGTLKYSVAAALTDSKLTAQFDDVVAEVSYDVNGGLIKDDTIYRTYSASNGCTLPTNVVRPGHTFKGWRLTSDTETKVIITAVTVANAGQTVEGSSDKLVQDTSVTAEWTDLKSAVSYSIGEGASKVDSTKEEPKNFTFTYGATNNVAALDDGSNLKKAGYEFKGWATSATDDPKDAVTIADIENTLKEATEDTPITLNAIWVPVTYKLTYAGLDGATFSDSEYELPKTWKATDASTTLGQPTKVGATFEGWTIKIGNAAASEAKTDVTLSTANITGDATITATWTALKKTTLKFDANAPAGAEAIGTMDDITIYKGASAKVPDNAFKVPGYKFTGWKNGDTPVAVDSDFAATATDEDNVVTLKAQWTGITNTIQYNKNDGTGIIADKSQTFTFKASPADSDKKALEVLSDTATEKFVGWALKRTATGAIYAPITDESDTNNGKIMAFIQPSYDGQVVTLYAVWQPKPHVTITWDYNGGTVDSATIKTEKVYAQGSVTAPAPTKDGHTLSGWKNGEADASLSISTEQIEANAELTFTAQWTEWEKTVTFEKNTEDANVTAVPDAIKVKYSDTPSLDGKEPTGAPADKEFKGWSTTSEGEVISDLSVLKPSSATDTTITLYAIWGNPDTP